MIERELEEAKSKLYAQPEHADKRRLEDNYHQRTSGLYLGDMIFGANDGIVTTFAVVAGASGAALSSVVVIVLGFANLMGDGLSMGIGNYLGRKSEASYQKAQREKERFEIEHLRQVELAETESILRERGYSGADLDAAMRVTTADEERWIDFMMRDELGIVEEKTDSPLGHGVATYLAFIVAGLIPLLPYLVPGLSEALALQFSIVLTALTLFVSGALRARVYPIPWWRAGLEMLLVGSLAAIAAYTVGKLGEGFVNSIR
jgi:VIT1/CCC1 family predicted Fe2+/Mn2+ transporter